MRSPYVVVNKKVASLGSKKKGPSVYLIAFAVLLLIVAAMSFVGMSHIQSAHTVDMNVKSISSIIKSSEEKFLSTAEQLIATGQHYIHDHMPGIDHTKDGETHVPVDSTENRETLHAPVIPTEAPKPSKKRLAYAIAITKDGPFQDGAAVLAYSIMKYANASSYDISLVAFVHPNVTASRSGLQRLGFHVIEVPTPVNTSAIQFPFLRDHIDKNGCCGAAELIKITSYRLLQYHRVIHLDADTMFLNPVDELYERDFSLIYTTDPNMASHKGVDKMPVQGGFIIMQPSEQVYSDLVHVVMNTEFAKGGAWNRSKIGWFWGGMTVQGVLPYYYNKVTTPGRSLVVDRCYYNTMADTPPCSTQQLQELKSAHFTVCQKPWGCWKSNYANRLCGDLHHRWFELRKEAEAFYGIPVNPQACPKGGHKHYVPMELQAATLPARDLPFFVPDDSPDRFVPIGEAKYSGDRYN